VGQFEARLRSVARWLVVAVCRMLRSLLAHLEEWLGMTKRIEITLRNPGFEQSDYALGTVFLDFDDERALQNQKAHLVSELRIKELDTTIVLENEAGQHIGFNPEYYVSHRVDDVKDWEPPDWALPERGEKAPERET